MKIKLPKSLRALIFVGIAALTTMNAAAVNCVDSVKVTNSATEIIETVSKYPGYDVAEYMCPVVVDATVENPVYLKPVDNNNTYDAYHPLYVREGQVIMTDGLKLNYLEPDFGAILQVAGKNASMVISNDASLYEDHKAHAGYVNIGGPDGSGTLILKSGGSIHLDKSLTAGYSNESEWGAAQTLFATKNADGTRYDKGIYEKVDYTTTAGQEASRLLGKATIIVDGDADNTTATNRTTLEMGNALFLGHADITVKNGGLFQSGIYATDEQIANSIYSSEASCVLGRMTGGTTNVNIESGGELNVTGSVISGYWGLLEDTTINIKVDGLAKESSACGVEEGTASILKVSYTLGLSIGNNDNISDVVSDASLSVSNGGTVEAGQIWLGLQSGRVGKVTATVDVDNLSSMKTNSLSLGQGAKLTNEGIISALDATESAALSIGSGATLTNSGKIELGVEMDGGTFTMADGAVAGGLTATSGTINLSGNVTFTGAVQLGSVVVADPALALLSGSESDTLTVYIAKDTNIVLDDSLLTVDGQQFVVGDNTEIIVDLGNVAYEEGTQLFTLSGSDGTLLTDTAAALEDKMTVTWEDEESGTRQEASGAAVSGSIATVVVPEPTTATLSLLALASLAMRRRRK